MSAQEADNYEEEDVSQLRRPLGRLQREGRLSLAPDPVREPPLRRGSMIGRAFRAAMAWTAVGPPS